MKKRATCITVFNGYDLDESLMILRHMNVNVKSVNPCVDGYEIRVDFTNNEIIKYRDAIASGCCCLGLRMKVAK